MLVPWGEHLPGLRLFDDDADGAAEARLRVRHEAVRSQVSLGIGE